MTSWVHGDLIDKVRESDPRGLAPAGTAAFYEQLYHAALSNEIETFDDSSVEFELHKLKSRFSEYGTSDATFWNGVKRFVQSHRKMSFLKRS
ncbi:hypothetical protein [Roseovarius sp. E0-M6]|uniref:hypothetical protein n=1 Tax=Roseovarius sp. E0-M6 TaxID=3127118 RepID=UPI00300FE1D4